MSACGRTQAQKSVCTEYVAELSLHTKPPLDLENSSFTVPCVFTVWGSCNRHRETELVTDKDFRSQDVLQSALFNTCTVQLCVSLMNHLPLRTEITTEHLDCILYVFYMCIYVGGVYSVS